MLQHSLWLTALVATVLFCHTPFGLIKPLWLLSFIVLVLFAAGHRHYLAVP